MRYNAGAQIPTTILLLTILLAACGTPVTEDTPPAEGDYFGQTLPGDTPELFAPGFIVTSMVERDAAFSPDGREFYYSTRFGQHYVMLRTLQDGQTWTTPEAAPFSGVHSDIEPFMAPDGSRLYFASSRPIDSADETDDHNIWYVERETTGWTSPRLLDAPVNTEAEEFYPSVTASGALYVTAAYENSLGGEDIFRFRYVDGEYVGPENLGESVNSPGPEFNAMIAPDESYILFSSCGRDDCHGGCDLYVSFRNDDDTWSPAVNLGSEINSSALDYCPALTPDGEYLLFASRRTRELSENDLPLTYETLRKLAESPQNGLDDLYWVNSRVIDRLRPR